MTMLIVLFVRNKKCILYIFRKTWTQEFEEANRKAKTKAGHNVEDIQHFKLMLEENTKWNEETGKIRYLLCI